MYLLLSPSSCFTKQSDSCLGGPTSKAQRPSPDFASVYGGSLYLLCLVAVNEPLLHESVCSPFKAHGIIAATVNSTI